MHKYTYIHSDGRKGQGTTSYNAVLQALGNDEGNAIVDIMETMSGWSYHNLGDRAHEPYQEATLYDSAGNVIGTLQKR